MRHAAAQDRSPAAHRARHRGHSAIDVTMTIYAHTSMDDKRAALGKLDAT
jgi:integrase